MKVYIVQCWHFGNSDITDVLSNEELANECVKLRKDWVAKRGIPNLSFSVDEVEVLEQLPNLDWETD